MRRMLVGIWVLEFLTLTARAGQTGAAQDPVANKTNLPYKEEFFPVEKDVKLQVLDWGGTGRAMILLAALGFDAHEWDSFAPKLVPKYHVYAITRRGFGTSSAPKPNCENYAADRFGG